MAESHQLERLLGFCVFSETPVRAISKTGPVDLLVTEVDALGFDGRPLAAPFDMRSPGTLFECATIVAGRLVRFRGTLSRHLADGRLRIEFAGGAATAETPEGEELALAPEGTLDTEKLWALFFESGLLDGARRRQLQIAARTIRQTAERLARSSVHKSFVLEQGNRYQGHVSALKFFDSVWLLQNVTPAQPGPAQWLLRSLAEHLARESETGTARHAVCYYEPTDEPLAFTLGNTAELVRDPDLCTTEKLDYCLPAEGLVAAAPLAEVAIDRATGAELIAAIGRPRGRLSWLNVERVAAESLVPLVATEFARAGLTRDREILVARSKGAAVFAVCNFASPGLDLAEVTNSFRLVATKDAAPAGLADALVDRVLARYQGRGIERPVLLVPAGETVPRRFVRTRSCVRWSIDLASPRRLVETLDYVRKRASELRKRSERAARQASA